MVVAVATGRSRSPPRILLAATRSLVNVAHCWVRFDPSALGMSLYVRLFSRPAMRSRYFMGYAFLLCGVRADQPARCAHILYEPPPPHFDIRPGRDVSRKSRTTFTSLGAGGR